MIVMVLVIVGICIGAYVLLIELKQAHNAKNNTVANNPSGTNNDGIYFVAPGGEKVQAIYLAPQNGGLITNTELKNYSQILKVSDFETLNSYTIKYIIPMWIDKDAIDILPQGWINQNPQRFYPIIVVGYSNALYAMREKLNLPICGPYVDWSKETLEPGFSVWMIKSLTEDSISSTMKGYQEEINVSHILEVSNELFKECFTTLEYKNTQYGFSFYLPLTWNKFKIIEDSWTGYTSGANGDMASEKGPMILIRSPQWTLKEPMQDIPIMVFTIEQWNDLQQNKFNLGAAPIGPTELGRNSKYVFALPARYNFAFPKGFEIVDEIIQSIPLKAF